MTVSDGLRSFVPHVCVRYTERRDTGASCLCCFTCLVGSSPHVVPPAAPGRHARTCEAAQAHTEETTPWRYPNVFHHVSGRTNTTPKATAKQQNILHLLYEWFLMSKHDAASCSARHETRHSCHFRTCLTTIK